MLRLRRFVPRWAGTPVFPAAQARRGGPFFALFPLPAFLGAGEIALWRLAAAALALVALGTLVVAWRHRRERARAERIRDAMTERRDRLTAVLAAAPGSFWTWDAGAADDDPGARGVPLADLVGIADDRLDGFADLLGALRPPDDQRLGEAVARLRGDGATFRLQVQTADGARKLEARGQRLAALADGPENDTVWFRDITEPVSEQARLLDRVNTLIAQNGGLRHVLDGLEVPVWVRGADLDIVYCNRAYASAVDEASPAAAVASGREIAGGPTGWGRALAEEAVKAGTQRRRSLHVVVEGQRRLFSISEFPVGGAGSPWRVAGIAIDRTDSDDARAELARHMTAHAEVLEKLGTGIIMFGPDTRVQFHNTAFARMWGLDSEWLKTLPTHGEMLEELRARRLYPEQPDFQDYKRKRMELYTSLIDAHEELLHLPDERVIRVVFNPHPLGGLLLTTEDVTDRLTLERSYNTLIAVQSETLDNLHEGVAVFGSDGRLKLFNPAYARIWRLDPDRLEEEPRLADVLDQVRDLFIYDGPWEEARDQMISDATDRTARGGRFERADGSILDFAAVPLPDGAMLFSYIDVTDSVAMHRALRERNEALLTADRLKSEFITNVSYELRTPLNTIIGFTEILSNQYFGALNERQIEYTQGILEASQQLLALIDNILDLALIESGQLELEFGAVDIRAMLDAVVALARDHARHQDLVLELDCGDDLGSIVADERRIKQSLFNLLSNAIKFSKPEGRIVLGVRREGDAVTFSVVDSGEGIADSDQSRVFAKFERGDGSGTRRGGVGLGLALVKSFVDLHGGTVELESELGEGTTVRMTIPTAPDESLSDIRPDAQAPWSDPGSGI